MSISKTIIYGIFLVAPAISFAEYQLTNEDYEMLGRFQEASAAQFERQDPRLPEFQKILGQPEPPKKNPHALPETPVYTIFLSESMGESLIKEAALSAKAFQDKGHQVRLAFRGHKNGENVGDVLVRASARAERWGTGNLPFHLDPPAFNEAMVIEVPVVVRTESGVITDRVSGTLNPQYLYNRRQVEKGTINKPVNHDSAGNTFEISEKDLIEVMKAKMQEVDWAERAKKTWSNYIKNKSFIALPPAYEDSERTFNPALRIDEDIVVEGNLLASAGDVLSPFDVVPIVGSYLIFDGTNKKQIEFAKQTVEQFKDKSLTLIATEMPFDDSLESVMELQNYIKGPIYLLDQQVKDRFKLKRSPTLITPNTDDKVFVLTEYKL